MNEITCATARELLLDAEPALLHARGDSPLERHLRTCASCRAAAQAILRNDTALNDALATLVAASAAPVRVRTSRRRWLNVALPLAAAAVLLLVLWQSDLLRDRTLAPIVLPAEYIPSTPIVNIPASGSVAVMRTSNPNITIVWNLES